MAGAAGRPRYQQVADELRAAIASGRLHPEGDFPTEAMLCNRYGVSRFTVREALRRLEADGLISRRRGSGTRVERATSRAGVLRQPLSNVGEILQYAHDTRFVFKPMGLVRLGARLARQVDRPAREQWYHFTGKRTGSGRAAIALTDAYVAKEFAPVIDRLRPGNEALFEQIERAVNIRIARVTQDITAVAASRAEAELLSIAARSPCLRILRCYFDAEERLVEISNSLQPGSRFTYSMHIER
jgi:DNA-binding GntR family transcriptional regulator